MNTDNLYQRVINAYRKTGSVRKAAEMVGTSLVRAQRILITEGLWSSPTSERILSLYEKGKTVPEIAEELFISEKTVQAYLPYIRTEQGYGGDDRSADAVKSEEYRDRMHRAAQVQVSEETMRMERDTKDDATRMAKTIMREVREALRGESVNRIAEESLRTDLSDLTVEELYDSHMAKRPEVLKLKLELDMRYVDDDDMEVLRRYGKVEKGITREILVPASITLHALNYAILRAFGWQNSHLHKFCLPKEVFQKLTGGKNQVDKRGYVEYDGKYKNWVKLCGLYFRYPCDDFDDLYWDDDYEEGQSIKTWMRKKYTGPYRYKGEWEHYNMANAAANEDMVEHSLGNLAIHEMMFDSLGGMDELLERIPLIELMIPSGLKGDPKVYDRIKSLIKQQQEDDEDHSVLPIAQELIYSYDYGDGWEVRITLEDCYYTKDADKTAFDMDNRETSRALALKVANVVMRNRPVCVALDGMSVMDDVGGIHGYIDFLKTIHGDDPDEREDMKSWGRWMGWTGRMNKPETVL